MTRVKGDYVAEHAGVALAARRGLMTLRALSSRSRAMYDTLTLAELEEMAPPDVVEQQRRAL